MKRIIQLTLLLVALLLPATAGADSFYVDDILYTTNGNEATVYKCNGSGNIAIPATVTHYGTTYSVTAIGDNAFRYSNGVTGVSIPNTVTTIGFCAFMGCTGLTNLTIPNSVITIDRGAFYQCTRLTEVTLGNSVTTLGKQVFSGCSSLTGINIPNSITSIGSSAFSGCTSLSSVTITDIASWYNISFDSSFSNPLSYAQHLYLNGALVTELAIPNSVTSIGRYAFDGCTDLTSVTIPNTVTAIGKSAFEGCSGLTSLDIPSSVTAIGSYAFSGCGGLNSITVASNNPNYDSRSNCNAIIETATNTLIAGSNSTIIPNSVTAIGENAFFGCTGLTSIVIPGSVTSIGSEAFYNCINLSNINFPSSVTAIGPYAFENTLWLNNQPDDVVYIGTIAYQYKGTMPEGTNITIKEGTLTIASNAFFYCSGLAGITIPSTVTNIGTSAFYSCTGLTNIIIPNSVTVIGDHAFNACSSLSSVVISTSVTTINDGTFTGCSGLTNIEIPNSVTSIGGYAFSGCSSLTSVTIPQAVTSIGDAAFSGCSSLTSVNIPQSVTSIGNFAFDDCSSLTSVTIPQSVTSIGDVAFSGCSSLTSVNIPQSVTSIGNYTFYNCSSLTSVTIPQAVTSIGNSAFENCSSLTNVTIPQAVTSIGDLAFENCTGLNTVFCRIRDPRLISMGYGVFSLDNDDYTGRTLYVPIDREYNQYYQHDSNWNPYFSNIQEKRYVDFEVDGLFYCYYYSNGVAVTCAEDNNIKYSGDISIPSTISVDGTTHCVTAIDESAFEGCNELTNVDIPNTVTTICRYAFWGCSGLTNVVIPSSVTHIESAWSDCNNIESVTCKAATPPSIDGNFMPVVLSHAPLFVPKASVKAYRTHPSWGHFLTIIGIDMIEGVPATSIKLNRAQMSLLVDDSSQLFATVLPDSTTNKRVAWVSSNGSVASVDSTGMVTAHAPGATIISALTTDGTNLSAQCVVTVRDEIGDYDNYLSMGDTIVFHGKTVVIPVTMTNASNIISFQTDLTLPEGLELVQEDDEYLIEPSSRVTNRHSMMSSALDNGNIRVICYSQNYKALTGHSGELFYLTVNVADEAQGPYNIKMSNSLLTTDSFVEIAAPDVTANVFVSGSMPGDANDNGSVTVNDVVVTSLYILDRYDGPFNFEAADLNVDGFITVTDVSRIAYLVLNPTLNVQMRAPAHVSTGDRLSSEGITLATGETRQVSIMLDNEMDYSAFQFDLKIPEGLTASNFAITDRAGGHTLGVNTVKGGNIRALCYSTTLDGIRGHEGTVLTFDVTATAPVSGDITVDGIELVTTACQTVKLEAFTIGVNDATAVSELAAGKSITHVDYYNLAGQRIERPENGVTLVVTTYSDGTRTTAKVTK